MRCVNLLEVPDSGTITVNVKRKALQFTIPNDGTNMSRGIKLLESAGLIEVKVPLDLICYVL